MPLSGKEMLRLLTKQGWRLIDIKGSHHKMAKDGKTVVVPVHGNRSLPKGTEHSILKRAEVKK